MNLGTPLELDDSFCPRRVRQSLFQGCCENLFSHLIGLKGDTRPFLNQSLKLGAGLYCFLTNQYLPPGPGLGQLPAAHVTQDEREAMLQEAGSQGCPGPV